MNSSLIKPYAERVLDAGLVFAQQESPCLRRKYCAQILRSVDNFLWYGVNTRYSDCCGGSCIRETTHAIHGQMVERGGEIHAEQLALIRYVPGTSESIFYLSGIETSTGKELLGNDVFPCHVCALMIKAAGFDGVVLRGPNGEIGKLNIDAIIKQREAQWSGETHS